MQGNNVFIGRDVTNQKPEGEVVVIKNSTKVNSPGGTTITLEFEVKPGAEFEISVEQRKNYEKNIFYTAFCKHSPADIIRTE